VKKCYTGNHVEGIAVRALYGKARLKHVLALLGYQQINTSVVERHNRTSRLRNQRKVRKTLAFSKARRYHRWMRWLSVTLYIETLYLHNTGDPNAQKPDDYMVDICHSADTGYLSTTNEYPIDTCSVSEASSELYIYVFHAREASALNWYGHIYSRTDDDDYPDHHTKRILKAQPTIQVYGYHCDVATLTDQQAIAIQMADFTGRVRAELGLQL